MCDSFLSLSQVPYEFSMPSSIRFQYTIVDILPSASRFIVNHQLWCVGWAQHLESFYFLRHEGFETATSETAVRDHLIY